MAFEYLIAMALLASLVCSALVWLVSLRHDNVAIADRAWPLLITVSAVVFVTGIAPLHVRIVVMLVLVVAWGLRLGLFITWRSWGQPEDRRYVDMRERNQPNFRWKSLYLVFGLQAVLAVLVALPFMAVATAQGGVSAWSGFDSAGLALALFGMVFEAIADAQMAAFKANAPKEGSVMNTGLWRYSRHPNYFGESCFWWGMYLFALSADAWWAVLSPILITFLLLKVSGINLQEQYLQSRGHAYVDYMQRTSAFLPWRPK